MIINCFLNVNGGMQMVLIPDDPIIRSIEQSGYPSWMQDEEAEEYEIPDEDE